MQLGNVMEVDRAWEATKDALETLLVSLRSIEGYGGIKLQLSLQNNYRCEVYKVSSGRVLSLRGKDSGISKVKGRRHDALKQSMDVLHSLSTKDFRAFFTAVRMSLRLKQFNWPESARCRFKELCDAPIPSGPGRANSGRDILIFMLRVCCEMEEQWDTCVQKELRLLLNRIRAGPSDSATALPANLNNADGNEPFVSVECIDEDRYGDGTTEYRPNMESQEDLCNEDSMLMIMERVKRLPSDTAVVIIAKREWVSMSSLMSLIRYPRTSENCDWYVQRTPADGNCLFSAVMVGANVRGLLPASLQSVSSIRETMRKYLMQFSSAGSKTSSFRRDWLASTVHDIEDQDVSTFLSEALRKYEHSGKEEDFEYFLRPVRLFVSNRANMVGGAHWGGLLRVELAVLASLTGSVIEVLQAITEGQANGSDTVDGFLVCDTRCGGTLIKCKRTDLVYPVSSKLPVAHNRFFGPIGEGQVRGGWVGPFPVLRVVLENEHYSACTSKHGYPISTPLNGSVNIPWSDWYDSTDTLVEPYSTLNAEENVYYDRALNMIEDWREVSVAAPVDADHADPLVMHSRDTELSVSMLSHLAIPNEIQVADSRHMLSDEIITCYMHLLERRAVMLSQSRTISRSGGAPRCRYMDSWCFKVITRGASGPSAERRLAQISSLDIIILPALVNGHWLLAVCYLEHFIVGVYDPVQERREDIFRIVKPWIERQKPPPSGVQWRFMELRESRGCKQQGVVDCGVYICKAAESYGLGIPFRMSQLDVPYVRKRMMVELIRQEAVSIRWPRK